MSELFVTVEVNQERGSFALLSGGWTREECEENCDPPEVTGGGDRGTFQIFPRLDDNQEMLNWLLSTLPERQQKNALRYVELTLEMIASLIRLNVESDGKAVFEEAIIQLNANPNLPRVHGCG